MNGFINIISKLHRNVVLSMATSPQFIPIDYSTGVLWSMAISSDSHFGSLIPYLPPYPFIDL